ncbi:type II toxin-antitoxin system VapC family toxin [Candidatus Peregrinibacteria bacterium]|nr:type II toxin-antitoxin system VapC family toxin [Candidatus Peregrinibacteria bacterium]
MNIVDSSAWLEYFAGTKYAKNFEKAIEATEILLVPAIVIYEVFKKILLEKDEHTALHVIAHMKLGKIIDMDLEIALKAAQLSGKHQLPMADSIILATAQKHNATIFTQDADFKPFKNVRYFTKKIGASP